MLSFLKNDQTIVFEKKKKTFKMCFLMKAVHFHPTLMFSTLKLTNHELNSVFFFFFFLKLIVIGFFRGE